MTDRNTMPPDPGRPVDEFDLELALAGAELSPERRAAVEAAAGLDPARAEIATLEAWWRQKAPALPSAPPGRSGPRRARWPWFGVAAAAAAALALWLSPAPPAFQARGDVAVDWVASHDGGLLPAGEPIGAGDDVTMSLVPDRPGTFHLASVQQDGAVTILVHNHRVGAGERFVLPGRVVLDGYAGREWLVLVQTPGAVSPVALEARMRSLLPDPRVAEPPDGAAGVWAIEVTRGEAPR